MSRKSFCKTTENKEFFSICLDLKINICEFELILLDRIIMFFNIRYKSWTWYYLNLATDMFVTGNCKFIQWLLSLKKSCVNLYISFKTNVNILTCYMFDHELIWL